MKKKREFQHLRDLRQENNKKEKRESFFHKQYIYVTFEYIGQYKIKESLLEYRKDLISPVIQNSPRSSWI